MQYLLMIHSSEKTDSTMTPEQGGKLMQAYGAYTEALTKAGVLLGANRLRPTSDATSVRVRDGKTEVLNGPYAETREQLGGYYLIEATDLNDAMQVASRIPSVKTGSIEVRPVMTFGS